MTQELSVCVEMLFREFGEPMTKPQLEAVKAAGIAAVEFWSWRNKDLSAVERAIGEVGISALSMLVDPPVQLVDDRRREEFLSAVRESVRVASRLGVPNLVVLSGASLPGASPALQRVALIAALREAAPLAEDAGLTLLLEPLNSRVDHPGIFLDSTEVAIGVLREVGSPNVLLLHDLYHSIVMGEEPERVLGGAADLIGHVQIADHPGRHEPGSGGVDWPARTAALTRVGYRGPIGLECTPSGGDSVGALEYIREVLSA